jgi:sec-independent protein translocase protein TatA
MATATHFSDPYIDVIRGRGAGVHLGKRRHSLEALMPLANIIGPELLIVLAIALVLFGSSRLPQLARSLGSAKNEFERGLSGSDDLDRAERDHEAAS